MAEKRKGRHHHSPKADEPSVPPTAVPSGLPSIEELADHRGHLKYELERIVFLLNAGETRLAEKRSWVADSGDQIVEVATFPKIEFQIPPDFWSVEESIFGLRCPECGSTQTAADEGSQVEDGTFLCMSCGAVGYWSRYCKKTDTPVHIGKPCDCRDRPESTTDTRVQD